VGVDSDRDIDDFVSVVNDFGSQGSYDLPFVYFRLLH